MLHDSRATPCNMLHFSPPIPAASKSPKCYKMLHMLVIVGVEQEAEGGEAGGYEGQVALLVGGERVAFGPAACELGEVEEHVGELGGHVNEVVIAEQVPVPG